MKEMKFPTNAQCNKLKIIRHYLLLSPWSLRSGHDLRVAIRNGDENHRLLGESAQTAIMTKVGLIRDN